MSNLRDSHELARRIYKIEQGAKVRTSQLAYSTIEDGAITSVDFADVATALYGKQFDGSDMALSLKGVTPLQPTQPTCTPSAGQVKVHWDGEFVESLIVPTDFSRVELHSSTDPGAVPDSAATLRGTFETNRGGDIDVTLDPSAVHYFWLVARNLAGGRGPASAPGTCQPGAVVDTAALEAIQTDVDEATTAAADAKAAVDGWTYVGSIEIDGGKIRADTIDAVQLRASSVVAGKIAANAVLAGNIKAGEITAGKLAAGAVIAGNLAANSIQAGNISAGAITADKLDANAINGKVITGTTLQTAASGARIVLKPGQGTVGQGNAVIQASSGASAEKAPGEIVATTLGSYSSLNIYGPANTTTLNESGRALLGLGQHPSGTKTQAVLSAKNIKVGQVGGELEVSADAYFAGSLYGPDGTQISDTGWLNATLASVRDFDTPMSPQYRLLNGVVYLRGDFRSFGTINSYVLLGTMPSAYAPSTNSRFACSGTGVVSYQCYVTTSGQIQAYASANSGAYMSIASVVYPLG